MRLTPKEKMVLERLLEGESNKIIARELGISPETVKSHVKSIFRKHNVNSRVQLLSKVVQDLRSSSIDSKSRFKYEESRNHLKLINFTK